jgi:hypothetical protein
VLADGFDTDAEAPASDRCTLEAVHGGLRSQTTKLHEEMLIQALGSRQQLP